jgi:hypothetical protein
VLAADAELQVGRTGPAALGGDLDQLAHAVLVDGLTNGSFSKMPGSM